MHNPIASLLLLGAAIALVLSAPSSSNRGLVYRKSTNLSPPGSSDVVYCVKPEESRYVAPNNNDFSSPQVKMIANPPDEFDYTALWVSEHHHGDGVFVRVEKKTRPLDQDNLGGPDDINFAWGIVPLMIKGTVGLQSQDLWVEVGINVPIFGYSKLFSSSGSLKDNGVKFGFDVSIASGSVGFSINGNHELWVQIALKSPIADIDQNAYILRLPV